MKLYKYLNHSRLAGAALLAAAATLTARADYQSAVLSQGPVGYWRLNETTQPPANDAAVNSGSLGASANGTYNSFPTRGLPGPFTGGVSVGLDGSAQSITTPWQAGLNPNSFSAEIWVNPASYSQFAYVMTSVHTASPRSGWYLVQDDGTVFGLGNGFVVRMFYQNGANQSITLFSTNDLPNGSWYHLVLTFDGTTAKLYKNGALVDSGTPLGFVPNVDAEFSVGVRSDNSFFWPGKVAEVAEYNTALSDAQVSAHYTAATSAPATYATTVQADSPVLYWRFNEPGNPTAVNLGTAGAAADGLYIYDARPGVTGPTPATFPGFETTNKAVAFDAGAGVVRIPPLNLNTNTVTITGWINATGFQAQATGLITCHGGTTEAGLTLDQQFGPTLGLGVVWGGNNYGWSPYNDSGLPALPDSGWAYVAMVIEPTTTSLYICDSNNVGDFLGVTLSFGINNPNQAFDGPTLIGTEAGYTGRSFNGAIDEVAIFNRALSQGELYTEYSAGVGSVPPRTFTDLQGPIAPVAVGDPLVLNIDVGGTPTLTYLWHKDGSLVATTTSGVLTIASASLSDSGTYDVTVTNASGSVQSVSWPVSVVTPSQPVITGSQGFVNRAIYPGGTLSMSVTATGGGLKYQWYKNATPIASATDSAYTIQSLVSSDAGNYSISVTNSVGTATNGPVAITVPSAPAGSYESLVLASAPEAWWRLGEAPGTTTMFDAMGRHDGYYSNVNGTLPPVTLGAPGALANDSDTAVTFGGNGGLGIAAYAPSLNPNQFSIEAWVKTSDTSTSFSPLSSSSGANGWWFQSIGGWWYGNCSAGYFGNYNNVNTAGQIVPGQWSHLVLTYDGTRVIGGTHYPFVLFVNGQTDGYVWGGVDPNNVGPFIIGARGVASTLADMFFNGTVDEVAVYDRVLGQTEVQQHFQGRFGATTPPYFVGAFLPQTVTAGKSLSYSTTVYGSLPITLQWYKDGTPIAGATTTSLALNNLQVSDSGTYAIWGTNSAGTGSQSVAVTVIPPVSYANVTNGLVLDLRLDGDTADSSGRGNNGTPVGNPGFVSGIINQGIQTITTAETNGTSLLVKSASYVTLGNPADLQFGAATSFSVSFWVKLPAGAAPMDMPFIGTATNSNYNPGWDLSPAYESGGYQWNLNDGVNNVNFSGPANYTDDGAWHNFVLVVDRANHVGNTYLDGVLVASPDIAALGSVDGGGFVNIGQDPTGGYPGTIASPGQGDYMAFPVDMSLDDIGIWRRALTPLEVAEIESAGQAGHGFDMPSPQVTVTATRVGSSIMLQWSNGTLLESDTLGAGASWTPVPGASAPSYTLTPTGTKKFYRVLVQ